MIVVATTSIIVLYRVYYDVTTVELIIIKIRLMKYHFEL